MQAITSNEALDLQELPKHVVIVGAGYIGMMLQHSFHPLMIRLI